MAENIRLHLMEDGFCLEVGGHKSDVVGYGEVAELVIPPGASYAPESRYIAGVDFGEEGERDAVGNDISGQEFPLTDYWVYKVRPVFDNEIEFVEVAEIPLPPIETAATVVTSGQGIIATQESEKGKEEDHVKENE